MPIFHSTGNRLTWRIDAPAPFESSWSIFLKVCSANYMNMEELASEIALRRSKPWWKFPIYQSGWIDFKKFGNLLRVDPVRLRQGFLDQLKFAPSQGFGPKHGTRHCPQCIRNGYHSVFFDFAFVDSCPIHFEPLTNPCLKCATLFFRKDSKRIDRQQELVCKECNTQLSSFLSFPELNQVPDGDITQMETQGSNFLRWQKYGVSAAPSVNLLAALDQPCMPGLESDLSIKGHLGIEGSHVEWALGYLQQISREPLDWEFTTADYLLV